MYTVRPNLHAVLGPGRDTYLNAGKVESTAAHQNVGLWVSVGEGAQRLGHVLKCRLMGISGRSWCAAVGPRKERKA